MKKKQIFSIALATSMCFLTACNLLPSSSDDPKLLEAPDYSAYTNRFESYGYGSPNPGYWILDDERIELGEDFRTVERYREYKDAGFSMLLCGHEDVTINSDSVEQWEMQKWVVDNAHEAGLKVILCDQRIQSLSMTDMRKKRLVGVDDPETPEVEEYTFASETELDEYIESCMTLYKDHPGFYGLALGDEPRWYNVEAFGQVFRSLKRVAPEIFIQYNLLPTVSTMGQMDDLFLPIDGAEFGTFEEEMLARYEQYLNSFMDVMTGVDYLQYDDYPMSIDVINDLYLPTLQVAAKVAKERDVELRLVTQTFSMRWQGDLHKRKIDEKAARWLNNTLVGFGVKQIHYFTYWTKLYNQTEGELFIDDASFVTRAGEKTEIYYFMQKIMAENQTFAPVVLNFDYQGSRSYLNLPTYFYAEHMAHVDNSYVFQKLTNVQVDKESALLTELYDEENNRFMYMVMNTTDTINRGSMAYQTTELTFSSEYTHVAIYKNGVATPKKLEAGNKLYVELTPGEAVYVIPY